jgi:hypothetical protein
MEIWVPVIVAVIALLGTIAGQGVSNSAAKHQLEAIKLVRQARMASTDNAVKTRLTSAELHLAKRIEVRYRSYTAKGAASLGFMFASFPLALLAAAGGIVVTLAIPIAEWGQWVTVLNTATYGFLAIGIIAGSYLVWSQQRESAKMDSGADTTS